MSLGPGPQFHPPGLLFWNLLGTPAQVAQSAAGTNCTELGGVTYEAGMFGGAVRVDANGEAILAGNYLNERYGNAGCVELWIYNDGWTINNGAPSAGQHFVVSESEGFGANLWWFDITFVVAAGIRWRIRDAGGAWDNWTVAAPIMDAGNQEWHHLALVWDATGIGGGANTRRFYWDGAQAAAANIAITMPVFPMPAYRLQIGLRVDTNTVPFIGRLDNIKWWNYAKVDFSDRFTEGFTPTPTPSIRAPECALRREPLITVAGVDITAYAGGVPDIEESRQLKRKAVFPNDAKIKVRNAGNFFSIGHPRSMFSGTNWQDAPVVIRDRWGQLVWDGLLSAPQVDHQKRMTTIVSRSRLSRWKNTIVEYDSLTGPSAGNETPADALENMAAAIGFTDLDFASLDRSKVVQAGLNIRVTLAAEDNVTFAQAIDRLCLYGVADAYEHLGRIHYVAWEAPFPGVPAIVIDESDILKDPKDTRSTGDVINDYAIYESATPSTLTDATAGNIGASSRTINGAVTLKDIASDVDANWDVRDVATAQTIGETWMRRTHSDDPLTQPRIQVEVHVRAAFRSWVNLSVDFGLTYDREAWVAKRFRVVGFKRDDEKRVITVRGLEW